MSQQKDPHALLAQMLAEEEAARKKAEEIKTANEAKRKELLAQVREADLKTVREMCQLHGFTATDLRGFLKTRGGGASKSTSRKSGAKRSSTRSSKSVAK